MDKPDLPTAPPASSAVLTQPPELGSVEDLASLEMPPPPVMEPQQAQAAAQTAGSTSVVPELNVGSPVNSGTPDTIDVPIIETPVNDDAAELITTQPPDQNVSTTAVAPAPTVQPQTTAVNFPDVVTNTNSSQTGNQPHVQTEAVTATQPYPVHIIDSSTPPVIPTLPSEPVISTTTASASSMAQASASAPQQSQAVENFQVVPVAAAVTAAPMSDSQTQPVVETNAVASQDQPEKPHEIGSPPSSMGGNVMEEDEVRHTFVRLMSWLFILLALVYGLLSYGSLVLVYYLNMAVAGAFTGALDAEFFHYYPSISLLTLVLILTSLVIFYAGLRLRDGSRTSWIIAVVVILCMPFLTLGAAMWTLEPVHAILGNAEFMNNAVVLSNLQPQTLNLLAMAQVGVSVMGLLLLIGYFKFRYEAEELSQKAWLMLVLMGILFFVPAVVFLGSLYVKGFDTDLGYTKLNQNVAFKIYQPSDLPANRVQVTKYDINQSPGSLLVGRDDFVQVYFDLPLNQRVEGVDSSVITLRQVDVPMGFDIEEFAKSVLDDGTAFTKVNVSIANQQGGYYIEKTASDSPVQVLTFVTNDHVLVLLTSTDASQIELMSMAESLE